MTNAYLEGVLRRRVNDLDDSLDNETLFFDTCGLNLGPWDGQQYSLIFDDHTPLNSDVIEWPKQIMENTATLMNTYKSKITPGVHDEVNALTRKLTKTYHASKDQLPAGEQSRLNHLLYEQFSFNQRIQDHVFHWPDNIAPIIRSHIPESKYQADETDINLVANACEYARRFNESVSIVTADKDIPTYTSFFNNTKYADAYPMNDVSISFFRDEQTLKTTKYDNLPQDRSIKKAFTNP